ncbi:MAG TPA: Fur family transcriptional regulator [Candidatus Saccharimonadales bacterium]|nr:Fur family transcriptional regulator [Candidatus Saccharimonadales bacterium]
MASPKETFKTILKEHSYSVTGARLAVFDALIGEEPMSMHSLVERVSSVDRASVYRAVELFEELGIAQRLYTGWKYKIELTDAFMNHHHHLTCTACGRTIPMGQQELELVIDAIARQHNFAPTAHQIEIQGICAECQARQGNA